MISFSENILSISEVQTEGKNSKEWWAKLWTSILLLGEGMALRGHFGGGHPLDHADRESHAARLGDCYGSESFGFGWKLFRWAIVVENGKFSSLVWDENGPTTESTGSNVRADWIDKFLIFNVVDGVETVNWTISDRFCLVRKAARHAFPPHPQAGDFLSRRSLRRSRPNRELFRNGVLSESTERLTVNWMFTIYGSVVCFPNISCNRTCSLCTAMKVRL